MARYFRYKSVADLAAGVQELGIDLPLAESFGALATPIVIGGRTVGNRLAIHPLEGCDGTLDGNPDALTYRRYQRFGAGGAKLIWCEATAVLPDVRANTRQLYLHPGNLHLFTSLVETTRQAHREAMGGDTDLLLGLQLTHSGRYSVGRPRIVVHCPVLDPLTPVDRKKGTFVTPDYPLESDEDLENLADAYVRTAHLAADAGFDFVDVKQCHRYLLNELLAATTREGKFGGSLENRARLSLSIFERIRAERPHLLLATRLNVFDGIPFRPDTNGVGQPAAYQTPHGVAFGTNPENPLEPDLAEPLRYIGMLQEAGVKLINVSMGCPYYNPHILRPAEQPPVDGYTDAEHPLIGVDRHFRLTAAVQAAYPDLAIVGSGYSYLQDFLFHAGAANIEAGRCSLVGLGRSALAYPHATRDILERGTLDRKSICRTFSICTNLMRSKNHPLGQFPAGCPPFDKEVYAPVWKEAQASVPAASADVSKTETPSPDNGSAASASSARGAT